MSLNNVMIDLETMDTVDSAVILAIGLVPFDDRKEQRIEELQLDSMVLYPDVGVQYREMDRTVSPETVRWHCEDKDRAALFLEYLSGKKACSVSTALDFLIEVINPGMHVWANAPSFDLAILHHLAKQAGRDLPFAFYHERDFRTIKHIAKYLGITPLDKDQSKAHRADYDAVYQACYTQRVLCNLKGNS